MSRSDRDDGDDPERAEHDAALRAAIAARLGGALGNDVRVRDSALGITYERRMGRVLRRVSLRRCVRAETGKMWFTAFWGQYWNWEVVARADVNDEMLAAQPGAGGEGGCEGRWLYSRIEPMAEAVHDWLFALVPSDELQRRCFRHFDATR